MPRPRSPQPGYTVSADLLQGMLDCATRCGMTNVGKLRDIPGTVATGPIAARFSAEHLFALWERLLRIGGDPAVGFRMALTADAKIFGVLGETLIRCTTVLDAFRQIVRYSTLVYQGSHFSVHRDKEAFSVSAVPDLPAGAVGHTVLFWIMTNASLVPQRLTGSPVVPRLVECTMPSPGSAIERAIRQRLPFAFDAPANRVIFAPHVADLRGAFADAAMHALLSKAMDERLAELGTADSFEQSLAIILRGMMTGKMPTLASLCARVGLSRRTLQRRLSGSKTTFQRVLQRVLHETSDELLARGTMTQAEIAFVLGYSEESAFSRAYRSWTGHAPGAARSRAVAS
jgi:AraC-like DNA-binding protein